MDNAPYRIGMCPASGYMFVVKHYGRWYLQDSEGWFYGPYEYALHAIMDKEPKDGRTLDELPVPNTASGSVH